jgi:hypothetical protein
MNKQVLPAEAVVSEKALQGRGQVLTALFLTGGG